YNNEFCDDIENNNEFCDNIEYDNEIYNTNSNNSTSKDETTFVDTLEIFDETNFNITWDPEDQFAKTAYHDLIQILLHPQFDKNHLVTNLQMLKKYQKKPPLMQIRSHKVPINARNTLSTTKNFTKAYYFSLIEYLHRILKNPNISSHLYFGSGILSESCEEFGIPQNLFSLERELQAQEWFLVEET
ncbi:7388_t:CDS:2, partial [Gigaspora rosea]